MEEFYIDVPVTLMHLCRSHCDTFQGCVVELLDCYECALVPQPSISILIIGQLSLNHAKLLLGKLGTMTPRAKQRDLSGIRVPLPSRRRSGHSGRCSFPGQCVAYMLQARREDIVC